MKPERDLIRGAGPTAVLQLLAVREMYGYELAQSLSRRTDGVLALGQSTLYPLLYNLESKDLVASRWVDAASGRRRRYYQITARGRAALASQRAQWQELFQAMVGLGLVDPSAGEG
jgi:PadR family transcriptional regulator